MPLSQIERAGFAPGDLELPLEPADSRSNQVVPCLDRSVLQSVRNEGHRVIATVVADEDSSGLLVSSFLTLCYQGSDVNGFQLNAEAVVDRAETQFFSWYEHEHG